jgi:SAM-dependent methyltransferase
MSTQWPARGRWRTTAAFLTSGPESLPLEAGTVDTVISYDVFEHVANPPGLLKDLQRVMRPSGVALIGTWGWRHPFAPHLWSVMPVPWAHLVVSERTLLRSCQRVYKSDWYVTTRYDFDDQGRRLPDKFAGDVLNRSYLNQYLIADFERAFASTGFRYESHLIPFQSIWAAWSRPLVSVPWLRELVTGMCGSSCAPDKAFDGLAGHRWPLNVYSPRGRPLRRASDRAGRAHGPSAARHAAH